MRYRFLKYCILLGGVRASKFDSNTRSATGLSKDHPTPTIRGGPIEVHKRCNHRLSLEVQRNAQQGSLKGGPRDGDQSPHGVTHCPAVPLLPHYPALPLLPHYTAPTALPLSPAALHRLTAPIALPHFTAPTALHRIIVSTA